MPRNISVSFEDGTLHTYQNVPDTAMPEDIEARAQRDFQGKRVTNISRESVAAKPAPETGFIAGFKSGVERLKGDVSAIGATAGVEGAEQYAAAQRQKAGEMYQQPKFTESPVSYVTGLLGQSVPYMLAPIAAGAAGAAAAPVGLATAAGAAAAGLISAGQFTGSNISRQLEEGVAAKDANVTNAVLASIPQAILDTIALRYIPGLRNILGAAGRELTEQQAAAIVRNGIVGTTVDAVKKYGPSVLKTSGVEGLTESAQQVLERAQAGLNITDEKAREEYFDSFIGGAVLGGTVAVPGRAIERGAAQKKYAEEAELTAGKARETAAAAEVERKAQPAYILGIADQHDALQKQIKDTEAQLKANKPPKKGASEEQVTAYEALVQQRKDLIAEFRPIQQEYKTVASKVAPLRERERVKDMTPQDVYLEQFAAPEDTAPEEYRTLLDLEAPAPITESVEPDLLQAQLDKSLEGLRYFNNFDVPNVVEVLNRDPALAQQYIAQQVKIPELTAKENQAVLGALKMQMKELGTEMAAGRTAATETRETVESETEALRRIGEKPTPVSTVAALSGITTDLEKQAAEKPPGVTVEPGLQKQNYNAKADAFADVHGSALFDLQNIVEDVERGRFLNSGVPEQRKLASSTREGLAKQAEEQKKIYVDAVLQEAANRRAAQNMQPITTDQATAAAVKLTSALDAMIKRAKTADDITRQLEVTKAQLVTQEPAKQKGEEKLIKLQGAGVEAGKIAEARGDTAQTLEGELRRRRDYVNDLIERAVASRTVPESVQIELDKVRDAIDKGVATRAVLNAAEDVADRALRGQTIDETLPEDSVPALRSALQSLAQVSKETQGQTEMFGTEGMGTIRATAPNLRKFLGSAAAEKQRGRPLVVPEKLPGTAPDFYRNRIDTLETRIAEAKSNLEDVGNASWESIMETRAVLPEEIRKAKQKLYGLMQEQNTLEAKAAEALKQKTSSARGPYEAANAQAKAAKLKDQIRSTENNILQTIQALTTQIRAQRGQAIYGPIIKRFEQQAQMFEAKLAELKEAVPEDARMSSELDALFNQAEVVEQEIKLSREVVADAQERQARGEGNEALLAAADERIIKEKNKLAELQNKLAKVDFVGDARRQTQTEIAAQRIARAVAERTTALTQQAKVKETEAQKARIQSGEGMRGVTRTVKAVEGLDPKTGERVALVEKKTGYPIQQKTTTPKLAAKETPEERTARLKESASEAAKERLERAAKKEATKSEKENIADYANTARTMARQETVTDIAPRSKRLPPLRTGQSMSVAESFASKSAVVKATRKQFGVNSPEAKRAFAAAKQQFFDTLTREGRDADNTSNYDDAAFRIGDPVENPVDAAEAKTFMDKVMAKLPANIKIIYAADLRNAPGKLLVAMARQGLDVSADKVKGAVLGDGTIVVIGNHHSTIEDLEKTVAHELAHYGTDTLLGPKGMQALLTAVDKHPNGMMGLAEKMGVADDVHEVGVEYAKRYEAAKNAGATDAQLKAIQNEGQIQAMRELIAHAEEATVTKDFLADAGRFIREMVGAVRDALRSMGFKNLSAASTSDIYYLLRKARKSINDHTIGAYQSPNGEIVFRRGTSSTMTAVAKLVRGPTSIANRIQSEVTGIGARTMFIDRLAPMERVAEYLKKSSQAMQMLYYGRLHDQRMSVVGAAVNGGAPTLITDEKGNYVIKSRGGANLMDMAKLFTTVKGHGNAEDVRNLFTAWMATKRAKNPGVGKDKLNFNDDVTQADMDEVERAGDAIPEFEKARKMYNEYNGGLVDWLVQSGAVSKDVADALLAAKDYIPYYRAMGDNIVMEIAGVKPVTIGNLQQQPYLKELVGGDQKIQDVFTSSLQNTSMIVDMGLRNLATKEMAFSLQEAGLLATKEDKDGNIRGMFPGTGPDQPNVIRFKRKGKDYYATVNSESLGIPSELLVKGLHGTATTIGGLTKLMAIPARFLRAMVTRSPVYAVRQIIRDSTSNYLLAGGDMTPVMSAGKELLKMYAGKSEGEKVLQERGIIGGQILTGTTEDTQKLMLQLSQGGSGWEMALAKLDRAAMKSDAASRVTLYNSFRKQGLSDMEATLATLESMNFSKRGASGSMHALNMMIPFLNSQIQGLDVLSKALRGKMPYNEKVNAQRKLYARGVVVAGSTLAYVAMMQDDEAYKNASMRERLSNWFIRVPGFKEAVRVPIPFEVGLIFKALPEAVILMNDKDTEVKAVLKGLVGMIAASTPLGLSSLPQGIKPMVEATLNKSFFTGQDIESVKERELLPTERVRDKTSGVAKMFSEGIGAVTSAVGAPTAGVSPIMIDHLINGYTGSVGLAIAQAAGTIVPLKEGPEAPTKRLSDMPVIGSMFQPNDATGQITLFYEKAKEYTQIKETFDKMVAEGRTDEATKFAKKYATQVAMADVADSFKETMGEFTELERLIKASDLSGDEKRARLDEIRKAKIEFSRSFNAAARQ